MASLNENDAQVLLDIYSLMFTEHVVLGIKQRPDTGDCRISPLLFPQLQNFSFKGLFLINTKQLLRMGLTRETKRNHGDSCSFPNRRCQ